MRGHTPSATGVTDTGKGEVRGHAPSATAGVLDTGEGEVRGHAPSATGVLDTGKGEVRGHAPSATGVLDTGKGEVRGHAPSDTGVLELQVKTAVYSPFQAVDNVTSRERRGRDSSCSLLLNRGGATEERPATLLFLRSRRRDLLILVTPVSLISDTSLAIQLRFSSPGCLSLYSIMSITLHCCYSTSLPHLVSHQHSCMVAVLI